MCDENDRGTNRKEKKSIEIILVVPPFIKEIIHSTSLEVTPIKYYCLNQIFFYVQLRQGSNQVNSIYIITTTFDFQVMNSSFEKNCVRPGDPGYEYDKQVDFGNDKKEEAGWDSPEDDFWS